MLYSFKWYIIKINRGVIKLQLAMKINEENEK